LTTGRSREPTRAASTLLLERDTMGTMDYDVIGAAVAVVGVLLWSHRDLKADIRALNVRIDNILLADRSPKS